MKHSQIDIKDFIIDWDCVQSGLGLIAVESFILALIAGISQQDLGIGIIAFFAAAIIFCIPLLGGVCMLSFSLIWTFIIWNIAVKFTSPMAAWIISIVAFLILISIHISAIDINEVVFCYSYLLFEALLAAGLLYITFKSLPISIGIVIASIVCAFLPVIRHIEGLALSIGTGITVYSIAALSINVISAGVIGGLAFIASELIYIFMNTQFSWKEIIAERKQQKEYIKGEIEYAKVRAAVYSIYPELVKDFHYFDKCVCQNEMERMSFQADWKRYIQYINDVQSKVEFNQWFEDQKLYIYGTYNRDFYRKYEQRKENTNESGTSGAEGSDQNQKYTKEGSGWFAGVKNLEELKKRYKDLLKIYHPDNQGGDTTISQEIQREYEQQLKNNAWG